jgi:DNA/RNA-binding domain of Phe-tRNA-synthetase-like protein
MTMPTAESLLTRVLRGKDISPISKVVDLYLATEMEFLLPIGGYDVDKVTGDIHLRLSNGNESFVPLGGQVEESTGAGEIVYADQARVLTRKWNFRDCDHAKVTTDSTGVVLFSEAPSSAIPTKHLESSFLSLKANLMRLCGGDIQIHLLDVSRSADIEF